MADKKSLRKFFEEGPREWIGAHQVRESLGVIADRTLRNWLSSLVREGVLERVGTRKGARYRLTERASTDSPSSATDLQVAEGDAAGSSVDLDLTAVFSGAALEILKRADQPLYTRRPVTYANEWVSSYVPNQTFYLTDAQRIRLHRSGKRPAIQGRAGTYIQKIYNRLLIDLSYNSSRLEGNTYSLADTERLVIKGIGAEGKLKEEQVMILNHKEAIRYLAQNAQQLTPDEETIRTLHYLLSDGLVAPELAGQFRDDGVLVSGTTYVPLEGRERLAEHLRSLLQQARAITDPFEQSFFLLGHVSYLQAFIDVNKRLARLASIIPLVKNDYVPQSFVDTDKNDYTKAMICLYEFNEVRPLAELYSWSYIRTCEHYDTNVQVLGFDELAIIYRPQRRALVGQIVKSMVPLPDVAGFLDAHMPAIVKSEHREKFVHDVLTDLKQLDVSRLPGLGVDRAELKAWLDANRGKKAHL
jgi:Fic family protein